MELNFYENMNKTQFEKYFNELNNLEQTDLFINLLSSKLDLVHNQFKIFFKTLNANDRLNIINRLITDKKYDITTNKLYIIWEDEYMTTENDTDSDNEDYEYHTTNVYDINKRIVDFNQIHRKKKKDPFEKYYIYCPYENPSENYKYVEDDIF